MWRFDEEVDGNFILKIILTVITFVLLPFPNKIIHYFYIIGDLFEHICKIIEHFIFILFF